MREPRTSGAAAPQVTTATATAPVELTEEQVRAKKKTELRCSLFCTDTLGRVGMINEIRGGEALFHYTKADGALEPGVMVLLDGLKIAKASELPTNHGLTAQQCEDIGYL